MAETPDKGQSLRLSIEVEIKITDEFTILDATEKAKALHTAAAQVGKAETNMVFGRQRYKITA